MKFKLDALEFKLDALEFFRLAANKNFCCKALKLNAISLPPEKRGKQKIWERICMRPHIVFTYSALSRICSENVFPRHVAVCASLTFYPLWRGAPP